MVFYRKDAQRIIENPVINTVWETANQTAPHLPFHNPPASRGLPDSSGGGFKRTAETLAQSRQALFVELNRLHQFSLGLRVVGQIHPSARRIDSIT